MKKLVSSPANKITQGSISKSVFQLAVPAMVSMVSIMLFEFVDLFWIGRLGPKAVAALGAASFVIWTLKSLANCISAGLNALVARNAGSQNMSRVRMWASQGMMLTFFFSIIIAGITYGFNLFLFDLLGLENEVAKMAQQYTLILVIGLFFIFGFISLESVFRASGNTFIPMVVTVASLTLNAILDPFLIFGWSGFPEMGMPGGALASLVSHTLAFFVLLISLPAVHIRLKLLLTDFAKNAYEILRIGTPIGLLGAIFSIIYVILSKNIAYFGTVPLAAISICHRIEGIPFFIAFGFSTAVSAIVGQNLGAKKPDRAEQAANISLAYAAGFLLITSIIFILFGKSLLGLFIDDFNVIQEGYRYLFAVSIFEVFLAAEITLEGVFTGAGDTKPPFLISIPLTLLRIPFAYFFSIHLEYGIQAVWWVISITTFLKGTFFYTWFRRGKWKYKKIG